MTLRARLILILAALVAFGFVLSGFATYGALRSFLYARVDDQLRQTLPIAVEMLEAELRFGGFDEPGPGDQPGLPIAAYAEARDANGSIVASESFGFSEGDDVYVPEVPADLRAGRDEELFTAAAREDGSYLFRVLTTPIVGGTLIVAIPLADAQGTLQRLVGIEVVVALCLLAALALLAWKLIRNELRPLDEMAQAATEIAGGDLSRRVEEGAPGTEVGRLGIALNGMLAQIEEAFDARKASEERMRLFLGDASHELRTPLTSIRGYAELFRLGAAERPEDLAVSMRRIEEEAARMSVLVDELLLLASADGMRPLETAPVALRPLAEDVAQDARVTDPARAIAFEGDDVVVTGDEVRLRQAVGNLVRNALVHTPPGTPVTLRVGRDGDTGFVTVEDAGSGLDDEALEHAFDRFWRRDPSRARGTGGAGLGLAIVAAIAHAHGGTVEAANRGEGGARFTIRVPLDGAGSAVFEGPSDTLP